MSRPHWALPVPILLRFPVADDAAPLAGTVVCVLLLAVGNAAAGTASTASFAATNNAAARHPRRCDRLADRRKPGAGLARATVSVIQHPAGKARVPNY